MYNYDMAVIGSGPAGQRAAVQAAKKGKKVVVIDRREYKLGGVSLHAGTIPSKTLREAVLYLKGVRRRKIYGPSRRSKDDITLDDLMERVDVIMEYEMNVIEAQLKRNNVDVLYGQASFIDKHNIKITSRRGEVMGEISARYIIIATGTVPRHPEDVPFDYEVIFDSNFIFSSKSQINKLPKTLIVYGAGVIGSEYAAMFAALGSKVWLMDHHAEIFPYLDKDIIKLTREHMVKMGIVMQMGDGYKKISITPDKKARIETLKGNVVEADALLFSKGRLPCVEPLDLDNVGLELTERKLVKVNSRYQTSVRNIYACGDVIGFPALASTSAEQGRVAARYALNVPVRYHKPELFPFAIYTIPEISYIGKTEQELDDENIPYASGIAYFNEIAKAAISGDDTGALKILFQPETHKLLGIHIMGEQAAEIIHIGQIAMACYERIDFFIKNVFNYPSWAEAYKIAALDGVNKLKEEKGN